MALKHCQDRSICHSHCSKPAYLIPQVRNAKLFRLLSAFQALLLEAELNTSVNDTRVISPQLWNNISGLQKQFVSPFFCRIGREFHLKLGKKWVANLMLAAIEGVPNTFVVSAEVRNALLGRIRYAFV